MLNTIQRFSELKILRIVIGIRSTPVTIAQVLVEKYSYGFLKWAKNKEFVADTCVRRGQIMVFIILFKLQ